MKPDHFSKKQQKEEINRLLGLMTESSKAREQALKKLQTDERKRTTNERQEPQNLRDLKRKEKKQVDQVTQRNLIQHSIYQSLKIDHQESKAKRWATIEDFFEIKQQPFGRKKKQVNQLSQSENGDSKFFSIIMKSYNQNKEKMANKENNNRKENIRPLPEKRNNRYQERQKQQVHHNQNDSSQSEEEESDVESPVQEIDQTLIYSSLPDNCPNHPNLYIQVHGQGKVKYSTFQKQKKYKTHIPPQAYYLLHRGVSVYMDNFIMFNWRNLIEINFSKCHIYDAYLQTFFENANVYPNVKFLDLYQNPFITFRESMPQDFHKLKRINFGKSKYSNKLTPQSIEEVRKYKQSHPHVTVICYLVD